MTPLDHSETPDAGDPAEPARGVESSGDRAGAEVGRDRAALWICQPSVGNAGRALPDGRNRIGPNNHCSGRTE